MAMQETTVDLTLTFDLTDKQVMEYGREASKINSEISGLRGELKALRDDFKGKITLKENNLQALLSTIRRGKEDRQVQCKQVFDFEAGVVTVWYGSRLVEERAMRPDEKQMSLHIVKE